MIIRLTMNTTVFFLLDRRDTAFANLAERFLTVDAQRNPAPILIGCKTLRGEGAFKTPIAFTLTLSLERPIEPQEYETCRKVIEGCRDELRVILAPR
jgi:hypothetical protein